MRSLIVIQLTLLALTLLGCGSSSASSTESTTSGTTTASSGDDATTSDATATDGPTSDAPVAHDTFRHECEMRRAAASCGGCTATYAEEPDRPMAGPSSCTRTEAGAQVACASECCMSCPQS